MIDFRQNFSLGFRDFLKSISNIHCVWEGGSAVTGYLDQYSDLDLCIICDDDIVEEIFRKISDYLHENFGILKKFRTPEPSWHGHSQCYYLLDKTPDLFYLDILIEKLTAQNRFMESDRHGSGILWFDKKDIFKPDPTPIEEVIQKGKKYYKLLADSSWILFIDLKKQILRENQVDAYVLYYQYVNRLSYLLNLRYRPARSDFRLRYTHRDFPQDTVDWLKDVLIVNDLQEMMKKAIVVENKYQQLLAELETDWSS